MKEKIPLSVILKLISLEAIFWPFEIKTKISLMLRTTVSKDIFIL
jgi:hypothetical protein